MLRSLGHEFDFNAVPCEVPDRVRAVRVAQASGVPYHTISDVVERRGLRESGVEPACGLIDRSKVTLGWVCIGDQELQAGILSQRTKDYAQDP